MRTRSSKKHRGELIEAYGYDIESGHTKSCGCIKQPRLKRVAKK